jgi:hypothetical protein
MAFSVASCFAQDTVVFNNDTGLAKQATFLPGSIVIINVAEGGGELQLFPSATAVPSKVQPPT